MRFPRPRLLATGAVLGALSVSAATAATLTGAAGEGEVALPGFEPPPAASGVPMTPPTPVAASSADPMAPVTGGQIAALAVGSAQNRATALIEAQRQAAAEQEKAVAQRETSTRPRSEEPRAQGYQEQRREDVRNRIREACSRGYLDGPICRAG
ncbi:hypothetical protein ACVGVM_24355 [Pseudonocardia bannensis]|uniref:Uncharacterized protein n=1 Tax=Pseudonocardia bannensis TaxID=630973 RepID=A0A848DG97_9PSEU|nr:hypothetical protein [Pseudonocardia bannensis]NMH91551.1 hypothetical protein [Pseudonocardia bannensis]